MSRTFKRDLSDWITVPAHPNCRCSLGKIQQFLSDEMEKVANENSLRSIVDQEKLRTAMITENPDDSFYPIEYPLDKPLKVLVIDCRAANEEEERNRK